MRSRMAVILVLGGLLGASFLGTIGCDGKPTAQVKPDSVNAKVGDTVSLEMYMRPKFDSMHHERWTVEPESLGEVYYDQASAMRRSATFRAKETGTGKIVVHGFLGSPPAHRLVEVPVTVE